MHEDSSGGMNQCDRITKLIDAHEIKSEFTVTQDSRCISDSDSMDQLMRRA